MQSIAGLGAIHYVKKSGRKCGSRLDGTVDWEFMGREGRLTPWRLDGDSKDVLALAGYRPMSLHANKDAIPLLW